MGSILHTLVTYSLREQNEVIDMIHHYVVMDLVASDASMGMAWYGKVFGEGQNS